MRFGKSIKHTVVAIGICIMTEATSRGADGPTSTPEDSHHELCVRALAPVLRIKPDEPAVGDSPLRTLVKLRHTSALRRLAHAAARVSEHKIPPERLIPALRDVCQSQTELSDDPAFQLSILQANLDLAKLIEAMKQIEAEVGRAAEPELEDARYNRLDAELRLARAKAAPGRSRVEHQATAIPRSGP
jgi:hypothetical protein